LTACKVTRDAIAEAVRAVGENEIAATKAGGNFGAPASADAGAVVPSPPGKHPCLDDGVKVDAVMTGYTRYMGGGGSSTYLKGPYICGRRYIGADFDIFDGATSTSYGCERQADRYVNCTVVHVDTITDVHSVQGGVDYHYRCGENQCWMHIAPVKEN
jgi:hypothetical protein